MNRLKKLYKDLGAVDSFWYILGKVLRRIIPSVIFRRYKFFSQEVAPNPRKRATNTSVQIRQVSQGEYDVNWFPRPTEIINARYRQNSICFVASKDEKAVACLWLSPGPYEEDEVRSTFIPKPEGKSAWDYDVYILPEYRISRIFIYLWEEAYKYMQSEGIKWTLSRIDAFNIQSIRSHTRMGAKYIGAMNYIILGNTQLMIGNIRPYINLSFNSGRIPKIPLYPPEESNA